MGTVRTKPTVLRDGDIRLQLAAWLETEYAYDTTTVICHELAIPRPSARIDVAVANGVLAAYEIKSDVDSLARLPRQVNSFGHVFERATLVTTSRHIEKAKSFIPAWWGILVINPDDGFKRVKQGRLNTQISRVHTLYLLTRDELISIARSQMVRVSSRDPKNFIVQKLADELRTSQIMYGVREALKARYPRMSSMSSISSGEG